MDQGIASPYSTSGAGTTYENMVGGYYLALLLLRAVPAGQAAGTTTQVKFQRRFEGEPMDDIIVVAELPDRQVKLALQVKHDLHFTEKDSTFDEVLKACWQTFQSSTFTLGSDHFGVVVGVAYATMARHYRRVPHWARTSSSAIDFLSRLNTPGLSSQPQRDFLGLIRKKLEQFTAETVSDQTLWDFLRSMIMLHLDFEDSSSSLYTPVIQMLGQILPPTKEIEAPNLFYRLVNYASQASSTAGSYTAETLEYALRRDGFSILPARNVQDDLARIAEETGFILENITTDINGIELPRIITVDEALKKMESADLVELVGPAGVGKTAIWKALVREVQSLGPSIVLSADRLNEITNPGWNGVARHLNLRRPLRELLLALSSSPRPTIFINDLDKLTQPGARQAVIDILNTIGNLKSRSQESGLWTIVITLREENRTDVYSWLHIAGIGRVETVAIPLMTDDEVMLVTKSQPRLRPLLEHTHLHHVTHNPFMLSLLSQPRMLPSAHSLSSISTEIEISLIWWNNVVGLAREDRLQGRARHQALLQLGSLAITSRGQIPLEVNLPTDALVSLETDNIIRREPDRDVYTFSHDLYEDWTLYRTLDLHRGQIANYLRDRGQPLGLLRALQLLSLLVLERGSREEWEQIMKHLEAATDLSPRWLQAWLTAPLTSARAYELLDAIEPLLITEYYRRLKYLMSSLRTVQIEPDWAVIPIIVEVADTGELQASLMSQFSVPRRQTWVPFIRWLMERIQSLDEGVRPEVAELMEMWQEKTPPGSIYRREIGQVALGWLTPNENWRKNARNDAIL